MKEGLVLESLLYSKSLDSYDSFDKYWLVMDIFERFLVD